MQKRVSAVLICVLALSLFGLAEKKSAKMASRSMPDKALMQKIWDGWSTLNPDNTAQFYAKGPHTFFDIAPLKYNSWDEYESGVRKVLAGYKSGTCTVNDDAQVHAAGEYAWGSATVKYELVEASGKRDLGNFRWTVIWAKQDGQWLIVHEHVSEPVQ